MIYIGVDVGLSTGVAMLNIAGEIITTGVIRHTTLWDSPTVAYFAKMASMDHAMVCVEYPEPNHVSRTRDLERTIARVRQLLPMAHEVRPGNWKNSAIAQTPIPLLKKEIRKLTQHELDAINIARWYRWYLEELEGQAW